MLRGRCACNAVAYAVSDEFVAAFNCHCSNCRAASGSAFLPWGEIEREKLRVTTGVDSLMVIGDADADHAMRCGACLSLLYWTSRDGTYVRVPYGSLVDEPANKHCRITQITDENGVRRDYLSGRILSTRSS